MKETYVVLGQLDRHEVGADILYAGDDPKELAKIKGRQGYFRLELEIWVNGMCAKRYEMTDCSNNTWSLVYDATEKIRARIAELEEELKKRVGELCMLEAK